MTPRRDFYSVITAAVADIAENGFDSIERLEGWMVKIRKAADESLTPAYVLDAALQKYMRGTFDKLVSRGAVLRMHPGVSRYTLDKVKPQLRAELDRRVMASANLIRLNRKQAIDKTIQRFSGWASSVPKGGSDAVSRQAVKANARKSLASLPFEERRVLIDQGHKFASSLSEILAADGGALAGIWHSHWRQPNYNYREDHKERDRLVYAVRGNWALAAGLMNKGEGYTDEITKPAEEISCRCFYQWCYALRDLPTEMLTAKGRAELLRVRVA